MTGRIITGFGSDATGACRWLRALSGGQSLPALGHHLFIESIVPELRNNFV